MYKKLLIIVCINLVCCNIIKSNSLDSLLKEKRIVVIVIEGFGSNYYKNTWMPFLSSIEKKGFYKEVNALTPTVSNVNNVAICCGNYPAKNGINGRSFLNKKNEIEFTNKSSKITSLTIFEKLNRINVKSALISTESKNIKLFGRGPTITISPEKKDSLLEKEIGKSPEVTSTEANYWVMDAAKYVLKQKPDIRCVYIQTSDYPMRKWAPLDTQSVDHLNKLDEYIKEISEIAPDAMILITSNYEINRKEYCVDIQRALFQQGMLVKMAIGTEKDKYLNEDQELAGSSYIYVNNKKDAENVMYSLKLVKGVKKVYTNAEAVKKFRLSSEKIGDLVVIADSITVFGRLDNSISLKLTDSYRSNGSNYDERVPLFIYNAANLPPENYFNYNIDLTTWLFK